MWWLIDVFEQISPEKFEATFGASVDKASELLAAKTLSIGKVLALAPPGTLDPTPHLYDTTMYALSGLMAAAVVSHLLVKPVKTISSNDELKDSAIAEVKDKTV